MKVSGLVVQGNRCYQRGAASLVCHNLLASGCSFHMVELAAMG
jgi:hypothetical protein